MKTEWTTAEILALPMRENDAEAENIRDYLTQLLGDVWKHRDGFNGKRPFGNSSWEYEIYDALAAGGVVDAPINKWNSRDYTDEQRQQMNRLIDSVIGAMGATSNGLTWELVSRSKLHKAMERAHGDVGAEMLRDAFDVLDYPPKGVTP